jgi:CRP-like cAMP-binding protein
MAAPATIPVSRSSRRSRPGENRLLAALPDTAYAALEPHLTRVSLTSGQVLYQPFARAGTVYFPDSAMLSIIARMSDGTAVEVGTVGSEGFAGLAVLFGVAGNPTQCIAQIPGTARALPAKVLRAALDDDGPLREMLLRYAHTYVHQVSQRMACSALHTVPERCARWLLEADDTAGASDGTGDGTNDGFLLTQEYLAYMLGVRREGVSAAERVLRRAGLIRFSRGRISVTDRPGLEAASCECYVAVRQEYRRVLGATKRPGRGSRIPSKMRA